MSWGQDGSVSRQLSYDYVVSPGSVFSLRTQSGTLSVKESNDDQVHLVVDVKGKDTEQVNLVSVSAAQEGDDWEVKMTYDGDLLAPLAPLNGLDIEYELFLPAGHPLELEHHLGEVNFEGEFVGELDLKLGESKLNIDALKGQGHQIRASLSAVHIGEIDNLDLDVKMGQVDIQQARSLNLRSLGAVVAVNRVDSLTLEADLGDLRLGYVGHLQGQYGAAQVKIDSLGSSMDLIGRLAPPMVVQTLGPELQYLKLEGATSSLRLAQISAPVVFLEVEEARFESVGLEAEDPFESPSELGGGKNYRLAPAANARTAGASLKVSLPSQGGRCAIRLQ